MTDEQREAILGALKDRSFRAVVGEGQTSVRTGRGDAGTTTLLFDRNVPKHHPRIRLLGHVDQLNATLGLGKVGASEPDIHSINRIQETLVYLMAEVATLQQDLESYGMYFHQLAEGDLRNLDEAIRHREALSAGFSNWVETFTLQTGFIELARTQARVVESFLWELVETDAIRQLLPQWVNRLADLLWLMARMKT